MEKLNLDDGWELIESKALKELDELAKMDHIDLDEFEQTNCWTYIHQISPLYFKYNLFKMNRIKVKIDGNVGKIEIYDKNKMVLYVIYSLESDPLYQYQTAIVHVINEEDKNYIRRNVRASTRIELIATYNGEVDEYDLISIKSISQKMKFGHYVCPKCGRDYGVKPKVDDCYICETDYEYVDDLYS